MPKMWKHSKILFLHNISVAGGKRAGHNFWKNEMAQGHNINCINWLESMGPRWQRRRDLDPQLASEWLTQRCHAVPRHCQKTKEWVVAQFLEISTPSPKQMKQPSHWLAYEITQPIKTNHTTTRPLWWPKQSVECASLWIWINSFLNYNFVSSAMRHQEPELH